MASVVPQTKIQMELQPTFDNFVGADMLNMELWESRGAFSTASVA